jgi:membrane-associated phospholipid phosphatase
MVLALALTAAMPARAGDDPVEVDWTQDVPATVMLTGAWLFLEAVQDDVVHGCGACSGPGPVDRTFRSWLLGARPGTASAISGALLWGVVPAFALGVDLALTRAGGDTLVVFGEDVMIMLESFVATALVTRAVKISVRRKRPYVHFGGPDPLYSEGSRDVTGFFSGHSSLAASLASSVATLAFLRGRRAAPWIAVSGAALALTTGTLRIVADRHYFTDVVTGLVVGTAIGVTMPLLHALPRLGAGPVEVAIAPAPGGLGVAGVY